ncbi:putative deoxyribonuclease TATDN2 isoform X2 [Rana temporaria]|uniref:putative deoxyribonuclease TATDN2 isoform X2 n=1 Tax=Rana temporaria TaxID=8407 RepID=UPI001AAD9DD3|nr:putative deoxyribonuclease TATDN2 isoform X2 [Rana temporaria]
MAERSGPRKHRWSSPPEMSPSKYLRGLDSKLPRGAHRSREPDPDGPSPPKERQVRVYPYESTPKRTLDHRLGSNSTESASSRGHRRTISWDFNRTDQAEASTPTPRASVSLTEGDRQFEMDEDTKTKSEDLQRFRPRRPNAPSLLFKRAFSDIGVSARGGRRSLDSQLKNLPETERMGRFQRRESEDSDLSFRTNAPKREIEEEKSSWRSESTSHPSWLGRTITIAVPNEELEVRKEKSRRSEPLPRTETNAPEREIEEEKSTWRSERTDHPIRIRRTVSRVIPKEEPEAHKEKPEVHEEKPRVRKERMEVHEEKPRVRKERMEVHEEKPRVHKEKIEVHEEKPRVRKERMEVHEEKPRVRKERMEVHEEKPRVRKERMEVHEETPRVRKERMEVHEEKPKVRKERMEVHEEKPRVRKERMEVHEEKPKVRKERMKVHEEKPRVRKERMEIDEEKLKDRKERTEDRKNKPETSMGTPRLVFLFESDKDSDTEDQEKDPSIGSDFSDVEDMGKLAKFSQEDEPLPGLPVEGTPAGISTPRSYVMYPRQLYNNSWSGHKDLWPTSPLYKPSSEQNKWRQDVLNKSCVSEVSVNHDPFSDSESEFEPRRDRSRSFDTSWTPDDKTKATRRMLEILPTDDSNTPRFLRDGFIDTHCHLDMLFSRLQNYKRSFADLREQYFSTFPSEFQGCITDYCDPRTLKRLPWRHVLNENMVWGAFGCHPHFAQYYNDQLQEEMMQAMRHPKAIAYGEMGLDYSHKCSTTIPDQHAVFEKQLKLAVPLGKPLVIHCRDADEDLFRIMKKWVPHDYKIHRHCFTGNYKDIEPFLDEFPNMSVGFTAVLTYPSAGNARDAVSRIPLDKLIVETDAPFFVPRQVPKSLCKFSHPGLAVHTVEEVARLKNLPVESVMAKLRENTYRLYNI